jgi:hypothetical protein
MSCEASVIIKPKASFERAFTYLTHHQSVAVREADAGIKPGVSAVNPGNTYSQNNIESAKRTVA